MHAAVADVSFDGLQGQLLRRTARREAAIFLRDGALWVADFIDGRGELADAATWFRFNCAARLAPHMRHRMTLEGATPLSDDLVHRIDALWPVARDVDVVPRTSGRLGRIGRRAMLALVIAACTGVGFALHDRIAGVSTVTAAPTAAATVPSSSASFPPAQTKEAGGAAADRARPRECRLEQSIDTDCVFN